MLVNIYWVNELLKTKNKNIHPVYNEHVPTTIANKRLMLYFSVKCMTKLHFYVVVDITGDNTTEPSTWHSTLPRNELAWHTYIYKIPCKLFFYLQRLMWVEFHSKAHGVWWMSWNVIKQKQKSMRTAQGIVAGWKCRRGLLTVSEMVLSAVPANVVNQIMSSC